MTAQSPLTPADVLAVSFGPQKRGYDTEQVDRFLDQVRESMADLIQRAEEADAARDAAVAARDAAVADLSSRPADPSPVDLAEGAVTVLTLAQKAADDLVAEAQETALSTRAAAEEYATQTRTDADAYAREVKAEADTTATAVLTEAKRDAATLAARAQVEQREALGEVARLQEVLEDFRGRIRAVVADVDQAAQAPVPAPEVSAGA